MLRRLQELPGFATHCLRGYAFWTEELSACSGSPGSSVWKSTQQGPLPLGEMKGSLVSRSVGRVGWAENAIPVCSFFQKRPRSWPRKPAWPSKKTATKNLEKKKKHQARQVPASWRQDRPASWQQDRPASWPTKWPKHQQAGLATCERKWPASWPCPDFLSQQRAVVRILSDIMLRSQEKLVLPERVFFQTWCFFL